MHLNCQALQRKINTLEDFHRIFNWVGDNPETFQGIVQKKNAGSLSLRNDSHCIVVVENINNRKLFPSSQSSLTPRVYCTGCLMSAE